MGSADEWTRSAALRALAALCARADASCTRALLDHALALYNGSAGARVSSEDKIALLKVSTLTDTYLSSMHHIVIYGSRRYRLLI